MRKVIIWFILFVLLNVGLKSYNNHLRIQLIDKQLEIEDYIVASEITLESTAIKPCSTSSVKSYMLRSAITNKNSVQYKFIEENMEAQNGLYVDKEGYIGVALGSWFGDIGTRWIFELSSGLKLYTVKIEHKDDKHTLNGCEHLEDKSVIEFVIDHETNPYWIGSNGLILNGNFNRVFDGTIVSVRKDK